MIIEAEKAFENPRDADLIMDDRDGSEKIWPWRSEIGNGLMSRIKLRSGLALGLSDFIVAEDVSISYDHMLMPISFNFCASWLDKYRILYTKEKDELLLTGTGSGSISYRPVWRGEMRYPRGIPIRLLTAIVEPSFLQSFVMGQFDQFPDKLVDIANGDLANSFEQNFSTTPAVNLAVHQVFDCAYQGALKRAFLEAKTLELITYALGQMVADSKEYRNSLALHPGDVKRVRDVRDMLLYNPGKPPSLLELARKSGTNKNKLNSHFKQVFGMSIFKYLRNRKLDYAKELLENRKMSVSEVAFEVGYDHARNFTRAFKTRFGTNPKEHLFQL